MGNKIQNVALAISSLHKTTIAAVKSYYPDRKDISKLYTDSRLVSQYPIPNNDILQTLLVMPILLNDGKTNFLSSPCILGSSIFSVTYFHVFTFTVQTSSALINTLRSQAMLIHRLILQRKMIQIVYPMNHDPHQRKTEI